MMGDLFGMYRPVFSPKIKKVLVKLNDFHICDHTVTQEEWVRQWWKKKRDFPWLRVHGIRSMNL